MREDAHLSVCNDQENVVLREREEGVACWFGCASCKIPRPPKHDQLIPSLDTTGHFGSEAVTHGNLTNTSLAALFDNYNHYGL